MYIYSSITKAATISAPLPEGAIEYAVKLIEADQRRSFTLPFVTDASWNGEVPSTKAVLEGMLRDVSGITESSTFATWAAANNRNLDSKNDERIFENLQRDSRRLRKFLGEPEYARAVANVDEYVKTTLPNIIFEGPRPKGRPTKTTQPEEAANAMKGAVPPGKTSKGQKSPKAVTAAPVGVTQEQVRQMVEHAFGEALRAFSSGGVVKTKTAPKAKTAVNKTKKAPAATAKKGAAATSPAPVVIHSKTKAA